MIEIKNLAFNYGKRDILRGINAKFQRGKFIGILGANGSGKSTFLKNIMQILTPTSGEILFQGQNLRDFSGKEIALNFGFVPQKSNLSMPLSVRDVLLMGRFSRLKSPFIGYGDQDFRVVESVENMLEIGKFRDRVALSLSGGEFGRVMIGRALVGEPKFLFLDEPTSAMDINFALEIMRICAKLVRENGLGVIIVLHDLNLASLFCDEIYMLKNGEILHHGAACELFTPEIISEIYGFTPEILEKNGTIYVIPKL